MGESLKGLWARQHAQPLESGAAKWGTGIDPIHAFYGGPPVRVEGRLGEGSSPDVHPPAYASSQFVETKAPWGYEPDDLAGLDVYADPNTAIHGLPFYQDGWPDLGVGITTTRRDIPRYASHPWGAPQRVFEMIRAIRAGARNPDSKVSKVIPTETVGEGWRNKVHGTVADAVPSDPSQYEMQTSMQQRYRTRNNQAAVTRGTDDPRTDIRSRATGQKVKVYSGGERHYDMAPFQQDQINRPFWYRQAATGPQTPDYLDVNQMFVATPLQRTPPADPYIGPEDDMIPDTTNAYGYTNEDQFYA